MSSDIDRLKEHIVAALDVRSFYERHLEDSLPEADSNGWTKKVRCILHGDQVTPNLAINVKTGGFKCFACGKSGSAFDFWMLTNGYPITDKQGFSKAIVELANEAGVDVSGWNKNHKHDEDAPKPHDAKKTKETQTFIPKTNLADTADASNLPIQHAIVEALHGQLTTENYKYLAASRGFTEETIKRYLIGWDKDCPIKTPGGQFMRGRYTIPIRDKTGLIRNVRLYSPQSAPETKVLNTKGFGAPARLFGLDELIKENWEHVVICEGELDRILMMQKLRELGLSSWGAVTGTHGASTFLPEWVPYLFGKSVYFCFDCDDPGKSAVDTHLTKLFIPAMRAGKFSIVKKLYLPLPGSKDSKDITDFFVKSALSGEDFLSLVHSTQAVIVGGVASDEATTEAIKVESLVQALKNREYIDKRIEVQLAISGQSSRIYHAVRSYKVVGCPKMNNGKCCQQDAGDQIIPYGHYMFIKSCMCSKKVLEIELANMACQSDQQCRVEPLEKVVMEEYFANQVVKRWRAEEDEAGRMRNVQELVQASVYILQPPDSMQIRPQNYTAIGWVRSHPNTNIATLFIEQLIPMEDDWMKFTMERIENREIIRTIKDGFSVDGILHNITQNVTKIYESDDILYAVLLTYLSPLWFYFNGSILRGWINSCIIGDSGTGKSATYERISDWLELGDLFSVLSGTRTGLLYAIKQKAGEWHVSVGRYVQASGRIIAIDETQETTPEDIKKMAISMDTGWLQVEQVASGGYPTQTRTILLLNPKQGKTISDYSHGCEALRECFDPMFIRRLDIAIFVARQHSYAFYNQLNSEIKEKDKAREAELNEKASGNLNKLPLTAIMMRSLVFWAWTRKMDQIIWSEEATKECLESATALAEIYGYSDDIPLINPQDCRNNVARLSTAYAILDRNFTDDLSSVKIEPRHVIAMRNLLDTIYSSNSCNLKQRSKMSRRKNTLEDFDKIRECFEMIIKHSKDSPNQQYAQQNHFCQLLLLIQQLEFIRKRDLQEQLAVTLTWVQRRIAVLQAFNMVEICRSGYKLTRKFNLFMQEWQEDEDVRSMLEEVHTKIGEIATMNPDSSPDWYDEQSSREQLAHENHDPFD